MSGLQPLPSRFWPARRPAIVYTIGITSSATRAAALRQLTARVVAEVAELALLFDNASTELEQWEERVEDEQCVGYKNPIFRLRVLIHECRKGGLIPQGNSTPAARPTYCWLPWKLPDELTPVIEKYDWVYGDNHISMALNMISAHEIAQMRNALPLLEDRADEARRNGARGSPEAVAIDRILRLAFVVDDVLSIQTVDEFLEDRASQLLDKASAPREVSPVVTTNTDPDARFFGDDLPDPVREHRSLAEICLDRGQDPRRRHDAVELLTRCCSESAAEACAIARDLVDVAEQWDLGDSYRPEWILERAGRHVLTWMPSALQIELDVRKRIAAAEANAGPSGHQRGVSEFRRLIGRWEGDVPPSV